MKFLTPMTSLSVLLEENKKGFLARVLGLPDCQAEGVTREQALENLRHTLPEPLSSTDITFKAIETPYPEHPWLKVAGMFEQDSQFDDMLAFIEADRQKLDAEMEEYYRQLDQGNSAA
jgi:hypothetical protein